MTRVLVCGGRDYARVAIEGDTVDAKRAVRQAARLIRVLNAAVDRLYMDELIHGGGTGADEAAANWAASVGLPTQVYRANWTAHGRAAGPIRNQQMIDEGMPDVVIAFPGGNGTADMVRRAEAAGITVHRIDWH